MMVNRLPNSAKPVDLMRALRQAGYREVRQTGGHRLYAHPCGVTVPVSDTLRPPSRATWRNVVSHVRRAIRTAESFHLGAC